MAKFVKITSEMQKVIDLFKEKNWSVTSIKDNSFILFSNDNPAMKYEIKKTAEALKFWFDLKVK